MAAARAALDKGLQSFVPVLALGLAVLAPRAYPAARPIHFDGQYLELRMDPAGGGAVQHFALKTSVGDLADGDGLLQEGLWVESDWTPVRKLNEEFKFEGEHGPHPRIHYAYDCIGRRTNPMHVTRLMEPTPDGTAMRVTWTVENRGDTPQWVAPWVRHHVSAGGALTAEDRLDLPTTAGVIQANGRAYHLAARNWIAVSDALEKETLYAVLNANQAYAFLTLWDESDSPRGFQAAFVPQRLEAGKTWKTVYWLNAVRGLGHVNFAAPELAVQVDCRLGELDVQLAAVKAMPNLEIDAHVVAPDGRRLDLPAQKVDLEAADRTRCLYVWTAPGTGAYTFRARLMRKGHPVLLGQEADAPHGDIEAPFVVGGAPQTRLKPWTQAPYALDRGPRKVTRRLAAAGETALWFETGLRKVFPGDRPEADGPIDPTCRIALARNERESFQVALRPPGYVDVRNVRIQRHDLVHAASGARIPAGDISAYNVTYHPIQIPSYFEGPTGLCPDALPPFRPFDAVAGQTAAIWFTVYARPDTPAGVYSGLLEIFASGMGLTELWIEARVYDFVLPETPALKTDFRCWLEGAAAYAQALGGSGEPSALARAYLENALEHRITLRELVQLPMEGADYASALRGYELRLLDLLPRGLSFVSVPPSLLDVPEQLEKANAFVKKHHLEDRAFVHLGHQPAAAAWPRLRETMQRWRSRAPDIPIMMSAPDLERLEEEGPDVWVAPAAAFDSPTGRKIAGPMGNGRELWWYVDSATPRCYANLFTDGAAIEHRILFWQSWTMGIRGVHYGSVNHPQPGQDPWKSALNNTPANGDGLLVYPGPEGPVNSIRWECIRDGIEDYDYLAILREGYRELLRGGADPALLRRAEEAHDLSGLLSDLASFPREPDLLLEKRAAIAEVIEALGRNR